SRAEGAGLDEFEIHPAPALGKERNATANQHRVDPGPVLVDQTQRGRHGGQSRPPRAMLPSAGSARNPPLSSATPPAARRALPCTADNVVENTTFGSGFQIAAHSSIESSSDGSWSAVSQYSIVSYSRRPNRWTPTSRISSVTKRKTSSSGAVQSKSPSGPTM